MTKLETALIEFIEENFGIPCLESVLVTRRQQANRKRVTILLRKSGGMMNRRTLQRKMSGVPACEFNDMVDEMIGSGVVRAEKNKRGTDLFIDY